jgi:hypothetical protein
VKMREEHGLKMFCYIDDYVLAGTREEVKRGMEIFTKHMEELGFQLAPWKTEGPCRIIDFLGLRLCNVPGERTISLPPNKLAKIKGLVDHTLATYAPGDRIHPEELARLLGNLNFAAQVIEPGQVFLNRMYSHFRGVIVDWKRGLVRVNGRGKALTLNDEFFTELRWWRENLEHRNALPLIRPLRDADGVVSGTDASDWGCGAVAWLSGAREEFQHRWGPWEKAQPINLRELIGATRILEAWGPRLAGKRLLLETDNMATMWCIRRRKARSALMAEQLRRMYAVAARYDIEINVIHTPGVQLLRPDGVSRGDDPLPPRQRLTQPVFQELSRRWGPFSEGLGAEMEHPAAGAQGEERRLWLHPSHATISATLKALHAEQLAKGQQGRILEGVILLPEWEAAQWKSLAGGMTRVGGWEAGAAILEEWRGRHGWHA